MMNPYRCQICGETFLGENAPERCPFCGALGKRVLPAAEWKTIEKVEMCEQSYRDCSAALNLEVKNAAYYRCAINNADNQVTKAIFKRLMQQELEHADVLSKAMGTAPPKPMIYDGTDNDEKSMMLSNKHEATAIKFYTEAAGRAVEPRIEEIFRALAEVENQHLIMTNMYIYR